MKVKLDAADCATLCNGFSYDVASKKYSCLFCVRQYEDGDIYAFGTRLLSAEKAMRQHISDKHGGVFGNLLAFDKSHTGLTDTQKQFLLNAYSGMTDREIAKKMNISASTVRYQRFSFREKARQAKVILALYELLEEKAEAAEPVKIASESDIMMERLFVSASPLILKTFDFKKNKDKNRLFVLETILKQFEKGRNYAESEVNAILKAIYADFATIRRSLITYGLMERTTDGGAYWVK